MSHDIERRAPLRLQKDIDILYEKLEKYLKRAEKALKSFQPLSQDRELAEVMDYSVFSGGKRLRPAIVYASAELFGNLESTIEPIACAVEFLHTASLLLDDLPSMDNTCNRRGLKATHVVFGPHATLLASHSFVSLAFQVVSESKLPDQKIRLIVSELAHSVGPNGMSLGQMQDLRGIKHVKNSLPLQIAEKKSAMLFAASSYAGAVSAGAPDGACNIMRNFGLSFGKAYQVLDDIRDAKNEDKPARSVNVVQLVGEGRTLKLLENEIKKARKALSKIGSHDLLEGLLDAIKTLADHELSKPRVS